MGEGNEHTSRDSATTSATPTKLRFLTWNLAMFERSYDAPTYWGQGDVEAVVRETVLELEPDIVLLQELPGVVPFIETHDMIRSNPRSHNGNLATLVTHQLMEAKPTPAVVKRAALLATFEHLDLTVANVHLSPSKAGREERLTQMALIRDAATTSNLAVIGDTNTRVGEEEPISKLGFDGERPPSPTWDGRRNPFRGASGNFSAYFTRSFTIGDVKVEDQAVLNDRPVERDSQKFYVSDHFALMGSISLP